MKVPMGATAADAPKVESSAMLMSVRLLPVSPPTNAARGAVAEMSAAMLMAVLRTATERPGFLLRRLATSAMQTSIVYWSTSTRAVASN